MTLGDALGAPRLSPLPLSGSALTLAASAPDQAESPAEGVDLDHSKAGSGYGSGQSTMSLRERWGGTIGARATGDLLETEPSETDFDLEDLALPDAEGEPAAQVDFNATQIMTASAVYGTGSSSSGGRPSR